MTRGLLVVSLPGLILLGALAACSSTPGGQLAAPSRCEPVPAALVSAISSGLTVNGGGSLSNAQAVRSTSFSKVWFVAARINGSGMGADSVGVWATNDLAGAGMVYAIDGLAHEFSDWGVAKDISRSDDGYAEARACAGGQP
jgi:hypothetical protein